MAGRAPDHRMTVPRIVLDGQLAGIRYSAGTSTRAIVVGGEQAKSRVRPRRTELSRVEFLEACDEHGRAAYSRILDLADRRGLSLKWGTTSFYIALSKLTEHRNPSAQPDCPAVSTGRRSGRPLAASTGASERRGHLQVGLHHSPSVPEK